ncbi:sugar ABC transporter permease [Candidatus Dependentiae bacterium]|nr:sugar ABC transporter permease [Candidatus Dependentiae bacterium]
MKNKSQDSLKEFILSFSFIIPLLLFIILFVLIPILGTIITSFFRDTTFLSKKFIFLLNYKQIILDKSFWQAFRFTLLFTSIAVPLEIILGLIFALLLNETLPLRGFLRVCILIPWAIPTAISARVWELIYNYNYGLANFLLLKIGISNNPINWLGTSFGAFSALILADTWKTTPFVTIIILAGLQTIPKVLYLQAQVDRTNFIQRFFRITLPIIKPIIIVALLFRTIDSLRIFDIIYVLSRGGPGGSTTSISLYSYKYFLTGDFGYASAVSVVLFLISLFLSIIYIKFGKFTKGVT